MLISIKRKVYNNSMNFFSKCKFRIPKRNCKLGQICRKFLYFPGCMTHRLTRNCSDMCFHSKYRSIDGTCNNFQHPTWGASLTEFRRILKPIYEDGFTKPVGWDKNRRYYGFVKPSSRLVSTTLISTKKTTPDPEITHMVSEE